MSGIIFATCERWKALDSIKDCCPNSAPYIQDSPDSAGPFLDLVSADRVRVAPNGNIVPGNNWDEAVADWSTVQQALAQFLPSKSFKYSEK